MDTRIVWFRRDLRVTDNVALTSALADRTDELRVVALFVLDPRLTGAPTMSPARLSYLCDALSGLDRRLRDRGSRLVLRRGDARAVVPAVAAEVRATQVHFAHDVTPFAAARDAAVRSSIEGDGITVTAHPGTMIRDAGTVLGRNGDLPRVYSPYRRIWEAQGLAPPLPAPADIPHGNVRSEDLPTVRSLGVEGRLPEELIEGGEHAAAGRLERFLAERAQGYATGRDLLGENGTSRLSADLHYGCVSPRAAYCRLDRSLEGHESFAQELIWRDFYGHVMWRWPEIRDTEFDERMRGFPFRQQGPEFDAWCEGRTGYPVVDAGMRQLLTQGWMHNRARMITASFLCKDLLVDWRLGQAHFLRHLVDADVASNNGGWQWVASTGTDPQPYFRIFNPVTQGERFDPEGTYVRRFVPELADVPTRHVHHPWTLPQPVAGYPAPIVDHQQARKRALELFESRRR
jgi:deoxyribodipyrimidine photo-lyase